VVEGRGGQMAGIAESALAAKIFRCLQSFVAALAILSVCSLIFNARATFVAS
jgi:hypothetical protein